MQGMTEECVAWERKTREGREEVEEEEEEDECGLGFGERTGRRRDGEVYMNRKLSEPRSFFLQGKVIIMIIIIRIRIIRIKYNTNNK